MVKIRDYINWYIVVWFMLFISVFIFFGCGSSDDENPESPLMDSKTTDVISDNTDPNNDVVILEAHTFTIDATNKEVWSYFSFEEGDVVEVADAINSEAWDIGFQRTQIKLNGGISGPGKGSAVLLTDTTFKDVTVAPENGYLVDSEDTLAIVPQSEMGWYIYTGAPTHWILPIEDRVFVITAADGTYAKVSFLGYYKDNQNKQDSGFVTFEYVHQSDGSRNF